MCQASRNTGTAYDVREAVRPDLGRGRRQDPAVRVSDAERDALVSLLADASAEGYLPGDELDSRLSAALVARTHGDLDTLAADLPQSWVDARARAAHAAAAARAARSGLGRSLMAYLLGMAVMVGIWSPWESPWASGTPGRSGRRSAGGSPSRVRREPPGR